MTLDFKIMLQEKKNPILTKRLPAMIAINNKLFVSFPPQQVYDLFISLYKIGRNR